MRWIFAGICSENSQKFAILFSSLAKCSFMSPDVHMEMVMYCLSFCPLPSPLHHPTLTLCPLPFTTPLSPCSHHYLHYQLVVGQPFFFSCCHGPGGILSLVPHSPPPPQHGCVNTGSAQTLLQCTVACTSHYTYTCCGSCGI